MIEPGIVRSPAGFIVAGPGNGNDQSVVEARLSAQPRCNLVAFHPRQRKIQKNDARPKARRSLQRGDAIMRNLDLMPHSHEDRRKAARSVDILVNHENTQGIHSAQLLRFSSCTTAMSLSSLNGFFSVFTAPSSRATW